MTQARAIFLLFAIACVAACASSPPAPGPIETGPAAGAIETSPFHAVAGANNPAAPAPAAAPASRYTLDGLVGQVNGKPVYARAILDPLHQQLTQLARQYAGQTFREQVIGTPGQPGALTLRVNEVVQNALILGEAERDLDEQEQHGLAMRLEEHRAELLRRYGRGSVAVAEQTLRDERDMTLAEALEDYRARIVVQRYLHQKLIPQINVTRRDIERYYHNHPEIYNPPTKRVVRLIKVVSAADAQAIADALASAGADFAELATGEFNVFKATGGKMQITGDGALAVPALNDALGTLDAGQHAGPFDAGDGSFWFVGVESIDRPESRPLKDVQLAIEETLRKQQFDLLRSRFMQRLYDTGSYTPREEMIARLYAIVDARYKASPATP